MELRAGRRAASNLLSILRLIASIHMIWKAVTCLTNCPCPIAVVTSESMEPAFLRGDVLFLWNRQQYINIGDIPVLWFENRKLPMMHRTIATHFLPDDQDSGTVVQYILTKGDNNDVDDVQFYPGDSEYTLRSDVVGVVHGVVPLLGLAAINWNELSMRRTTRVDQL